MPDIKISQLSELVSVNKNDYLPVVDNDTMTVYKATVKNVYATININDIRLSGNATQSLFTTQSLFSTRSLNSTQSKFSDASLTSTQSISSSYSLFCTQSSWSSVSQLTSHSVSSIQSLYSTQSLTSIQTIYSTQSLNSYISKFNISSSCASSSISAAYADTASYLNSSYYIPTTLVLSSTVTSPTILPLSTIKASSLEKQMPVTISLIGGGGGSMANAPVSSWGGGGGAVVIIKLSPSEVYTLQGKLECYIGIAGSRNNGNGGDTYITVNSARLHKATAGGGGVGSLNHGAAGVATFNVGNQFPNDTGSNGSFTPFYTSGLPSKKLLTFPIGSLTSCMYDIMYKNSIFNAPYGKGADVGPYNGNGRYMPLNAGTGCIKITYFPPS